MTFKIRDAMHVLYVFIAASLPLLSITNIAYASCVNVSGGLSEVEILVVVFAGTTGGAAKALGAVGSDAEQ